MDFEDLEKVEQCFRTKFVPIKEHIVKDISELEKKYKEEIELVRDLKRRQKDMEKHQHYTGDNREAVKGLEKLVGRQLEKVTIARHDIYVMKEHIVSLVREL